MEQRVTIAELRAFDVTKDILNTQDEAEHKVDNKFEEKTVHDEEKKHFEEKIISEEKFLDPQESSSQELLIEKEPPVNINPSDLSNIEARGVEDVASTPVRRGTRIRVPSRKILDNMAAEESHQILKIQSSTKPIPNPKNDEEALNGPYAEEWLEADRAEINHMLSRNLWKVVPKSSVPPGKRIIGCRFERVVKWKVENPTEVEKFKSRLVAQGYNMRMGIDFSKKFAKVVRIESVMLILAVMNHYDLNHNTYDIKAFFLHGDSEEEVYIRQPPGFETHNKMILCAY